MTSNNTEYAEARIFSQVELKYIEDRIQAEVDGLKKEWDHIQARMTQQQDMLAKIRKLRTSNGSPSDSIADQLNGLVQDILGNASEGMRLLNILNKCHDRMTTEISRNDLFDYLKKNKGILYEVIGQRGGAKWILMNRDEQDN